MGWQQCRFKRGSRGDCRRLQGVWIEFRRPRALCRLAGGMPALSRPVRVPAAAAHGQEASVPRPSAPPQAGPPAQPSTPAPPAAQGWQSVRCPGCGHRTDFRRELAGKRVRCKRCSEVFRIALVASDPSHKRAAPSQVATPARPRAAEDRTPAASRGRRASMLRFPRHRANHVNRRISCRRYPTAAEVQPLT